MTMDYMRDGEEFDVVIAQILLAKKDGSLYPYRGKASIIPSKLQMASAVEHKQPIEISSTISIHDNPWGETTFSKRPEYAGEGVLLGKKPLVMSPDFADKITPDPYHSMDSGFKIWALSEGRMALHLFWETSDISGRSSGLGYTGSEEKEIIYRTPFRRVVLCSEEGVLLVDETNETVRVIDWDRTTYSGKGLGGIAEFFVMERDEKGKWSNASRGSYDTTYINCPLDWEMLSKMFSPIAKEFGVNVKFNGWDMARDAIQRCKVRYIGRFCKPLHRDPFVGEIQRGIEIPSVAVDTFLRFSDSKLILMEKQDLFDTSFI